MHFIINSQSSYILILMALENHLIFTKVFSQLISLEIDY